MAGQKPKLVAVISTLNGGGAEKVLADLCSRLRTAWDIEVVLTNADGSDGTYDAIVEGFGIPITRLALQRPLASLRRVFQLRKLFAERRPDLVLSFLTGNNAIVSASLRGLGIPHVLSERNNTRITLKRAFKRPRLYDWLFRRAMAARNTRAVVAVSDGVAEILRRDFATKARIVAIQNGLDAEALAARKAENPDARYAGLLSGTTLCAVGRLNRQKNYPLLLNALAHGGPQTRRARLLVLGNGEGQAELERLVRNLGIGDRVTFCGFQRNPHAFVSRATAYVMCSDYEGFPNALAEAMFTNGHCVSTDCPTGPDEIIENGKSGLLVPVGDEKALAEAIERMLTDGELRNRCAENARAWASEHTLEKTAKRWNDLLREAAGIGETP